MNPLLLAAGIGALFLPAQWLVCLINSSRLNIWLALLFAALVFLGTWLTILAVTA